MTQRHIHPHKKPTQTLSADQIERLKKYRQEQHVSFVEMNARMESPFGWPVLQRAMAGQAVWDLNYAHIVAWIDRNLMGNAISEGEVHAVSVTPKNDSNV